MSTSFKGCCVDYQLRKQLRQVLTYASPASVNYAGEMTYNSTATVYARIEPYHRELSVGTDIIEERTKHMIILDPSTFTVSQTNIRMVQFTLPGETQPRRAREVHFCYDEKGTTDHIEVIV